MLAAVSETVDHKEQAIRCWTAVPCGSRVATDQPGTRPYIESLLAGRHAYAPWMATELGYESAEGVDAQPTIGQTATAFSSTLLGG
jgi:hypothetical protein